MPKIVPMPKRTAKLDDGNPALDDYPALPLPEPNDESLSIAKINKWIALGDIALGQGIGRKIA